ncbi:hypothetical protein [Paenibacillus sp. UMB4589-SE434]|uniref:hypothetical protein n=1 Tax=Paenibacillus sp. UMB4589-SE434 TaxID=3046314 RepID=UPI00254C0503|nr:hypothetical protein [Paenibacillus sp. UMB4589-SE434]
MFEGDVDNYSCDFRPPATESQIQTLLEYYPQLPSGILEFLKITNGCSLFEHAVYGGCDLLLGVDEVIYLNRNNDSRIEIASICYDHIIVDISEFISGNEHYMYIMIVVVILSMLENCTVIMKKGSIDLLFPMDKNTGIGGPRSL